MTAMMKTARGLIPGLFLCFTIATAASFLSEHYGAPVMLFALLLGMAFHYLSANEATQPGIEFTSKRLLRIGVALLGARVTMGQIASLGIAPLIAVPALVATTMLFGVLTARLLGRGTRFGILTGGAVAICGASAALAIAAAMPAKGRDRDTLFTVVAVTTLSTLAMIIYPVLFAPLGLDDAGIGMLFGATIHDVAQVVGAGYAVSEVAGDVATYVKLLRVTLLPVVVIVIALFARRMEDGEGTGRAPLPWFAFAFAALLAANSLGYVPVQAAEAMSELSRWLLIGAISALGVKTSLKAMTDLGPRHIGVVVAETVFLALAAIGVMHWF
ncbi:MAG: YeiH family protein [Rhodothalassiaceae bacterium]